MNLADIKLEFTHNVQEMEIILAGLKKLPMEIAMELYAKLHASANAQVTAQTVAAQEVGQEDMNTLVLQPGVPQELQDQYTNFINSPTFQADVNQAEANSDSMANE